MALLPNQKLSTVNPRTVQSQHLCIHLGKIVSHFNGLIRISYILSTVNLSILLKQFAKSIYIVNLPLSRHFVGNSTRKYIFYFYCIFSTTKFKINSNRISGTYFLTTFAIIIFVEYNQKNNVTTEKTALFIFIFRDDIAQ